MPDVKDRQSEEEKLLNPEERHYKERFDDIVGNMSVAEPDRPQKNTTDSSSATSSSDRASQTSATKRDLNAQEGGVKKNAANLVDDLAGRESTGSWANKTADKALGKMGATGRAMQILTRLTNKRGSVIATGVGVSTLFLALIVPTLSPFKVPGIMDLFGNYRGAKVERITERAAERILYQAIASKVGTKGNIVYRPGSPLGTLFATWRTNNFEQRLVDKYGLEIIDAGNDGVRLNWNGRDLGTGRTANDIKGIFERGDPLLRSDIKKIVSQDIAAWRWMKRAKFANWLKIKYGIPRYGDEKSDNADPEEQRKEVKEKFFRSQYTKFTALFGSAMGCLFQPTSCSFDANEASDKLSDDKAQSAENSTTEAVDTAVEEVIQEEVDGKNSGGVIKKLTQNIITLLGTKAIPIVGQIDFVAWIIVLINEINKNEWIAKLPVVIKSEFAGFTAGVWAGIGDDIKSGRNLNANSVGAFAEQWDGAETSKAFNYVAGNGAVGTGLKSWQKINEKQPLGPISDLKNNNLGPLGETNFAFSNYNPQWLVTKGVAYAWYYTVGAALQFIGDTAVNFVIDQTCKRALAAENFFDDVIDFYTCEDLSRSVDDMTAFFMGWIVEYIMGMDPADRGAKLANNVDQGLAISNETFCKEELGCGRLNEEEAAVARKEALAMQKERFDLLPLHEKIFSHESNYSVASQLAMNVPGLGGNLTPVSTLSIISSVPGAAFSSLFKPAQATEAEDLYGIWEYDIPEWAFEEIPEEMFTGDPCPELNEDGEFVSSCRAFLNATEALEASETGDDGSGFNSGGGGASTADGNSQELAQQLLDLIDKSGSSISFGATSSCGPACVREPFERVARGEKANVPAGNASSSTTDVSPGILKVLIAAAEEGIPMRITALTTGTHSQNSAHYSGTAVDIGNAEDSGRVMPWLFNNRQELDLYDVFHDPTPQYNINDGSPCNCSIGGHGGHIHIGVSS